MTFKMLKFIVSNLTISIFTAQLHIDFDATDIRYSFPYFFYNKNFSIYQ